MWTILIVIVVTFGGEPAITSQQMGKYDSVDVCNTISKYSTYSSRVRDENGFTLHTQQTARCVQVKDKP